VNGLPNDKPRLRPVEAFGLPGHDGLSIGLRDRSGLSDAVLTMSPPALHVLSLMDGVNTCSDIRRKFAESVGQTLAPATLTRLLAYLEKVHWLEGPAFEAFYQEQLERYRAAAVRPMCHTRELGVADDEGGLFADMLADAGAAPVPSPVKGLVAPHLDYPRGRPCYAAAYATIRGRNPPDRVVVLGTNHFGRSTAVVATGHDFETPLGVTKTDVEFLSRLETRCGDLRAFELDHLREHSIELQVAWLQYLFGAAAFRLVALLCPDPCGSTGATPFDGRGGDLRGFAHNLADEIQNSGGDSLLIAGADLSHVGAAFGDHRLLDDENLAHVRRRDEAALSCLVQRNPDGFVHMLVEDGNSTNMCSAGCLFALATALPHAQPTLLLYHQAVNGPPQTCVTCAAMMYT